jgi:hypothetical protein
MIVGSPGVGKSDIVEEAAQSAGAKTIIFHPVISDPTDFKGFPFAKNGEADFLPYGDLKQLIEAKEPTVAFLDDIGQAPPSVQASCFMGHEKVVTKNGIKEISEIRENDYVLTGVNKFERVTNVFEREYEGDINIITTKHCLNMSPTDEHPVYIKKMNQDESLIEENRRNMKKTFEIGFFPATAIKRHDYIGIPVIEPYFDSDRVEVYKTSGFIKYYKLSNEFISILACYCACGSYDPDGGRLKNGSIVLRLPYTAKKADISRDIIKKIMGQTKNYEFYFKKLEREKVKQEIYELSGYRFADFVRKHCGEGDSKQIPYFILNHKDENILKTFLIEYQKFSGWFHVYKQEMTSSAMYTHSDKMAMQIQQAFMRFGSLPEIKKVSGDSNRWTDNLKYFDCNKEIYAVYVRDTKGLSIYGQTGYGIDPTDEPNFENGLMWTRVLSVDKQRVSVKVYNLEVEGSHTYTVSNMLVHNCMHLLQKREIGGKKISDNVVFIAATNEKKDKAGVKGILEPVKSRFFSIIRLEPNVQDWIKWAIKKDISIETIAFVRGFPDYLQGFEPSVLMQNTPSPRTIEHADRLYQMFKDSDSSILYEAVKGAAGEKYAIEFLAFIDSMKELPTLQEIIDNPCMAKIPEEISLKFAVSTMLGANTSKENIEKISRYIERLDHEFQFKYYSDILERKPEIGETSIYTNWILKNKDLIAA